MCPSANRVVSNYLKDVGVRRYPSFDTFTKYLQRKYGKNRIDELLEMIDRRGQGEDVDIYPLLYSSLELSIDFLGFETDLHSNYLQWLLSECSDVALNPSRVLDIGCGNGVLTCFYAKHFSDSEVVGVDDSTEAVTCAQELSRRLGLTNIQFMKLNLLDNSSFSQIDTGFDLITAIKVMGTAIQLPDFHEELPLRTVLRDVAKSAQGESLGEICRLLHLNGTFMAMDRWSGIRSFAWWVCALNNAGFFVDLRASNRIEYFAVGSEKTKRIPVLWNKKVDAQPSQLDDALGFWLHARYSEKLSKLKPLDFQHDLAEMAFSSINPKSFRFGISGKNEMGTTWMEIWQAGPFLLIYQFGLNEYRHLEVLPSMFYNDSEEHLREVCGKAPEGTTVSTYDSPHLNWD
jgi:SAM-dependent methyltransferase